MNKKSPLKSIVDIVLYEAGHTMSNSITRIMRSSIVVVEDRHLACFAKGSIALVSCLNYIPELTESTLINKFNQLLIEREKTL